MGGSWAQADMLVPHPGGPCSKASRNAQALRESQLLNRGWVGVAREAVAMQPGEDRLVRFASTPPSWPPSPRDP